MTTPRAHGSALSVDVRCRRGSFALEIAFDLPPRSIGVITGESGAGKTTLLRLLAGVLRPDAGTIVASGRTYFDSSARVDLSPSARAIGWMPQEGGLFPHLSIEENVAFGLRATGVRRDERRTSVHGILERFGLSGHAKRRPHQLSGGEQRRAALARALVLSPEILLLDEPLTSLDGRTRGTIRAELREILASLDAVTLLVTHDRDDAAALGGHEIELDAGRIVSFDSVR